ncbi:12869_t:CDS:10, partial [Acaulospora colombiana]
MTSRAESLMPRKEPSERPPNARRLNRCRAIRREAKIRGSLEDDKVGLLTSLVPNGQNGTGEARPARRIYSGAGVVQGLDFDREEGGLKKSRKSNRHPPAGSEDLRQMKRDRSQSVIARVNGLQRLEASSTTCACSQSPNGVHRGDNDRRGEKWVDRDESHLSATITSTEPRLAAMVIHSDEKPGPSGVLRMYWEGWESRFILRGAEAGPEGEWIRRVSRFWGGRGEGEERIDQKEEKNGCPYHNRHAVPGMNEQFRENSEDGVFGWGVGSNEFSGFLEIEICRERRVPPIEIHSCDHYGDGQCKRGTNDPNRNHFRKVNIIEEAKWRRVGKIRQYTVEKTCTNMVVKRDSPLKVVVARAMPLASIHCYRHPRLSEPLPRNLPAKLVSLYSRDWNWVKWWVSDHGGNLAWMWSWNGEERAPRPEEKGGKRWRVEMETAIKRSWIKRRALVVNWLPSWRELGLLVLACLQKKIEDRVAEEGGNFLCFECASEWDGLDGLSRSRQRGRGTLRGGLTLVVSKCSVVQQTHCDYITLSGNALAARGVILGEGGGRKQDGIGLLSAGLPRSTLRPSFALSPYKVDIHSPPHIQTPCLSSSSTPLTDVIDETGPQHLTLKLTVSASPSMIEGLDQRTPLVYTLSGGVLPSVSMPYDQQEAHSEQLRPDDHAQSARDGTDWKTTELGSMEAITKRPERGTEGKCFEMPFLADKAFSS